MSYSFTYENIFFQLRLGRASATEEQEDFCRVITSTEEIQAFIDEDLSAYCEKMKFINEKQYERLLQHLQSLDESFFAENVYVITVSNSFSFMADLYNEGLVDIGESEEDELYGKVLRLSYGYGRGDMAVPGVVIGGTVISLEDLEGKELVKVEISASVSAEPEEKWEGNFKYKKSKYGEYGESCMEIVDYRASEDITVIEIPSIIEEMEVKIIGECAFQEVTAEKIILPDSVGEIRENAFLNSEVKEIILPEKLKTIKDNAFYGITGMDSITLPRRMETIGKHAFGSDVGNRVTIRGYEGSLAESYADVYGHPFVSVGKLLESAYISGSEIYAGNVVYNREDYDISANDALMILKYIVGLEQDINKRVADANQNGVVDATDALYVLKCSVGLENVKFLDPQPYKIYESMFGYLKHPFKDDSESDVPNDLWCIFESKEEVQAFINGDLMKYSEKLENNVIDEEHPAVQYMQNLDDEFFADNVYVISIIGHSGFLTEYHLDCLEDVEASETYPKGGKRLRLVWGELDEHAAYPDLAMGGVFCGVAVPRRDLDGKELVEVHVSN